jgi:hypothetical protein
MTAETYYPLLTEADVTAVREKLLHAHQHFFHFTLDMHVSSIVKSGIDPAREGEASKYGDRTREPAHAMRYCTQSGLDVGLRAAMTRNSYYDYAAEMWKERAGKIVLLRTPAAALLNRSFGLDLSFGDVKLAVTGLLGETEEYLEPDDFIRLIDEFGVISSYEMIPASEFDICADPGGFCRSLVGTFTPLVPKITADA